MLLVGVAVVCADVVVDVGGVVIGVVGIAAAVFDANVGAAGIAANVDVDVGGGAVVLDVTVSIVVNVGADVVVASVVPAVYVVFTLSELKEPVSPQCCCFCSC